MLPPPALPEPVNLFTGLYECTLCEQKFEEMMELAEHVKTHMTQASWACHVTNVTSEVLRGIA